MSDDKTTPVKQPEVAPQKLEPYKPPPGLGPDFVRKVTGEPDKKS